VARYADCVNVMYAANMVEQGTAEDIFAKPRHPYTLGLMRSVPRLDQPRGTRLETIEGLPPNLLDPPTGCRFAARCPAKIERCPQPPPLDAVEPGHLSRCWRARELAEQGGPARLKLVSNLSAARANGTQQIDSAPVLLEVDNLTKHF